MYNNCYNPCNCPCTCHQSTCSKECMYYFLGKYTYDKLTKLIYPSGHPSLDESLCAVIKGEPLPSGHPSLDQVLCKAFNCSK